MIDLTSKVLLSFQADVSDLKKGLGEVSAAEKKLLDQQIKASEARNASLESWVKRLGTAAAALGAIGVAGKLAFDGVELSARKAQLSANVSSDALVKLRKGFGGLRTEMQSLEVANKLAQSSYKLTGEQMEAVGRAIRQLVREGSTWEDASRKVTESIVKLEGDALKDFGIRLREAKTDGEKFEAILEGIAKKSGALSGESRTAAESIAGVKTEFAQAADSIKESLGKVVVALEPLIQSVAKLATVAGNMLGGVANGWADLINLTRAAAGGKGSDGDKALFAKYGLKRDSQTGTLYYDDALSYYIDRGQSSDIVTSGLAYSGYQGRSGAVASSVTPEEWARLQKLAPPPKKPAAPGSYRPTMPGYSLGATEYGDGNFFDGGSGLFGESGYSDIGASIGDDAFNRVATERWKAELEAYRSSGASKLESIFGKPEEFDVYKKAFEGLTGAVSASYAAWIDGSTGAAKAFKNFIADAMKALAVEATVQSLRHLAMAAGYAFIPGMQGQAAGALKAAALWGGVAAAAGVGAKQLGTSASQGASGGSSVGGGVSTYSGGGSQPQQANSQVVVVGQDYSNDSARERQLRAARALELARQAGSNPGVHYA